MLTIQPAKPLKPLEFVISYRTSDFSAVHVRFETMARHDRLTDLMLPKLPVPRTGAVIYPDETVTGFGVRVSRGGTRTFVLTYGRERRRVSIGRVGVISLADARKSAKAYLASETLGKRSCRSVRWQAGVDEYLGEIERTRKPRTHHDYKRLLARFSFPGLLTDIHPQDITRKLDRLSNRPTEKLHSFAVLRQFFNWAYRKHYIEVSPMARMQQPKTPASRDRVLTDEELGKVWRACGEDNFGRIVKLLILTGQRRGEITAITSDMIDGDTLTFPAWLTKNGRAHTIPIGAASAGLITSSIKTAKTSAQDGFLFPAKGSKTTSYSGFSKAKIELDKRAGVSDWTLHDLRRTVATGLAGQGVSVVVVEKILNHTSGQLRGVAGIYNRYDFQSEMRDALLRWEEKVLSLGKELGT